MSMLQEIRQKYPDYQDLSDEQLADALHKKFYNDMPREQFNQKVGLVVSQQSPQQPPQQQDQRWGWQKALDNAGLQTMKDFSTGVMRGNIPFADEITAAAMTPFGMAKRVITGQDADKGILQRASDAYSDALSFNRGTFKEAQDRSPVAHTLGQVAGGINTAGALAKGGFTLLNPANPTVGNMAARGAAEGALYSGIYGFGEGEGFKDRANKAAWDGLAGAAIGGATGAIAAKLARIMANKSIPSADALEQQAKAAYKTAENAGVVFKPMNNGLDKMIADANKMGLDKTLTPNSTAAVARLEELRGVPATLETLELKRRIINNAVKTAAKAGNDADVAILNSLRSNLDNFVGSATASDLVAGGDPRAAVSALKEARKLWAMQSKSELIADAVESASLRAASTGSGGNVDNATRQNLRRILGKQGGFSKAESDALETAVRGTKTQNALRRIGKLSPEGNGLSLLLHSLSAGAAIPSGGTSLYAQVPIAAVGMAAKRVADRATGSNVRVLDALIRSGGSLPQAQISPAQKLIIDSLLSGQRAVSSRQHEPVR